MHYLLSLVIFIIPFTAFANETSSNIPAVTEARILMESTYSVMGASIILGALITAMLVMILDLMRETRKQPAKS